MELPSRILSLAFLSIISVYRRMTAHASTCFQYAEKVGVTQVVGWESDQLGLILSARCWHFWRNVERSDDMPPNGLMAKVSKVYPLVSHVVAYFDLLFLVGMLNVPLFG
jgi:hypothetical protein